MGRPNTPDEQVREWHAWYMEDTELTYEDVAFEFGVSIGTVGKQFRRLGLPTKGVGQRPGKRPVNKTNAAAASGPAIKQARKRAGYRGHRRRSKY